MSVDSTRSDRLPFAGGTINGIQILRGLASLIVVFRHIAKELSGSPFELGQVGVDIFFVISGFVIMLTAPKLPPAEFAIRRFMRVVPLYWMFLALTILGDVVRHRIDPAFAVSNGILSFFFIPSHDHAGSMFPPLVVGWSLNFEVFFYVVAAIVLATVPVRRFLVGLTWFIGSCVLLGFLLRTVVEPSSAPITILLLPITLEFLAGAWLARWWMNGWRIGPPVGATLIAVALAWLLLAPAQTPYTLWRPIAWGVPGVLLVLGTLAFEPWLGRSTLKPLHRLGDASYSLYLGHPIVIGVVLATIGSWLTRLPYGVALVAIASCSVIAGLMVHYLLEKPLLKVTRHAVTHGDRRRAARV